jgi:hypothetical protein
MADGAWTVLELLFLAFSAFSCGGGWVSAVRVARVLRGSNCLFHLQTNGRIPNFSDAGSLADRSADISVGPADPIKASADNNVGAPGKRDVRAHMRPG